MEDKPEINKEELEKKVMTLRQKLQILEWDAQRDQINPAKRFELEQLRKEYEELRKQLLELEAAEKPKEDKKEKDDDFPLPEAPEEKEGFVEKVKDVVEKIEEKFHLKKHEDEDLFKDEVEADEEIPEEEVPEAPEEAKEEETEEPVEEKEEKPAEEEQPKEDNA